MRAARVTVLILLAACAGVGEPMIAIEARGTEFWFRSARDGRPPAIWRINVNAVDRSWRAVEPVVCLLLPREGGGAGPVPRWSYGQEIPGLAIQKCGPLAPQRWYRIGVAGGGGGNALFSTDGQGRITIREPR